MNATSVNAGARLDRLPLARFHWKILGLISGGALLDAFDVYLAAGVLAALVKSGFSTLELNAAFISATFFGMLIGSALAGYVGDRFGRRYSYQINLAVFGIASLLACFAPNMPTLIVLRFIMGLGLGAELVVAAGTLCEFVPPAYRGRWISLMGLIINSGLLIATSVGYIVIPNLGWRWMFAIAGAGALAIWIMRKRMPESPRWLESVGRTQEAEATLADIEGQVKRQFGALPPVPPAQPVMARNVPLSVLFSKPVIGRTLTAALTCVAINVAVYGFVAWLPTFFVKQGLTVVQSLGFTTLMAFGAPGGALVGYLLGDRLGRQRGLVLFSAATIVLGFLYPQMRDAMSISIVGFCLVTAIYTIVTLGLYGYIPELFPTAFRLRGTGFAGVCGRAASMSTPYLAVALFQHFGISGVLAMVSGVLGLLIVALLVLRVETNQQSLEDISVPSDAGLGGSATTAAMHAEH
ncbi:MFS transporter [Pandoraea pnomenusa 3kgm]|uniref:MFS transporter n=1 Tax=Pandoraea pnomenusa TaxID=93220 RepID=UPI0003C7439C|nr:MFS transporter [Pandoraea pnomenusa]AHB05996.1 MFS transporter [Pandoraea pnomenusa 3kgm]QDH59842.1 MFS transporter [Pandoraea pnomenusa]